MRKYLVPVLSVVILCLFDKNMQAAFSLLKNLRNRLLTSYILSRFPPRREGRILPQLDLLGRDEAMPNSCSVMLSSVVFCSRSNQKKKNQQCFAKEKKNLLLLELLAPGNFENSSIFFWLFNMKFFCYRIFLRTKKNLAICSCLEAILGPGGLELIKIASLLNSVLDAKVI